MTVSFVPSIASIDENALIRDAIKRIKALYSDDVSVEQKSQALNVYGYSDGVGTASTRSTLWFTGQDDAHESFVTDNTNSIDSISSSSASDTEAVTVEGYTMSGDNLTFSTQTVTLTGQARVALTTGLNRCTKVFHAGQSATDLVGEIYVYENTGLTSGKPTDTTKIHATVPAGDNTSQKACAVTSSDEYWLITSFSGAIAEKSGSNFADIRLEVRETGSVFKAVSQAITVPTGGYGQKDFTPYLIVPKNCDIRLTAVASAASQTVSGEINGFLAKVL